MLQYECSQRGERREERGVDTRRHATEPKLLVYDALTYSGMRPRVTSLALTHPFFFFQKEERGAEQDAMPESLMNMWFHLAVVREQTTAQTGDSIQLCSSFRYSISY
jgi:hypothetical protein